MSQATLADRLGLTFQQVQKYERGSNRISASKLYEIAAALEAPIGYFFEGLPSVGDDGVPLDHSIDAIFDRLMAGEEGPELAKSFPQIASPHVRRAIVKLVRAMATPDS